ncbi:right-handed parallel beta-helix repeat-containing protein [Pseudomonas sp. TMW22090]|uniref:right-handed parallel beta-helix repeat-containing protein n=1 Tax=Pseudomonas sp. TMW22090 TaxID=2506434 RepID=UPI001F103AC5|nr:right-handed parallel beta-helix repeat-containing protein [Pseudomonas sp. TMW22090]MCH4880163.1 right-handed parallel beta-helix repeat-containing protein [Pseudomonas sp. TMW22090]
MVNRRNLLKLSALGTASFAAPQAYSASKITMAYNTGNAPGSKDPRDLIDNSEDLDLLMTAEADYEPNRLGAPLKSWKGMEREHDSAQARRESEFDVDQAERVVEFNEFLDSSGYETPVDYAPGISITRVTQQVRYLGELYRPKDSAVPFVTAVTFDEDAAKWISNGQNSLRQEMAAHGADMNAFVDTRSPAYLKTISDIINMEPVNVLRLVPKGTETTKLHNGTSAFPLAARLNALISDMSTQGGGKIELTHGKHMLENYVEFLSNVSMEGLGDSSVFKGMFASPVNRLLTSPALVGQSNISLKNFKVDRTGLYTEHGIILGGIDGLTIDNVSVWGFRPGVDSGAMGISPFNDFATIQSKNVDVKNCKIYQPNNFGIAFGNVSGGTLYKNLFTDAWREAIGLETWGATSAVEDVVVSKNILRMSTDPANHHIGSVGPAILVGGAGLAYGGVTRRCLLDHNIITIANPANQPNYGGIVVIGGPTDATAAEDIVLDTNTIYNAPSYGIGVGAAGSFQRRVISRNNNIINPNSSNGTGAINSAIYLKSASGCSFIGDIVTGSKHRYVAYEDDGAVDNTFLDIIPGSPVTGKFRRNQVSSTSVYRDPTSNQVIGGKSIQDSLNLLNGASGIFTARSNPNRGLYLVICSSGAYAIICMVGTAAPTVIAKSADVVVAATDTGTASALTLYPSSVSQLGVTNRLGAAGSNQTVAILSLNAL